METGSSGSAKSAASGDGMSLCASTGRRVISILAAVRLSIATAPFNSAARCQSSFTSVSVNQMPSSSAMVIVARLACDDNAPRNPVMITCRPAEDRLSSRKAVR